MEHLKFTYVTSPSLKGSLTQLIISPARTRFPEGMLAVTLASFPQLFIVKKRFALILSIFTPLASITESFYCFLSKHFILVSSSSSTLALHAFWTPINRLKGSPPLTIIVSTSDSHTRLDISFFIYTLHISTPRR